MPSIKLVFYFQKFILKPTKKIGVIRCCMRNFDEKSDAYFEVRQAFLESSLTLRLSKGKVCKCITRDYDSVDAIINIHEFVVRLIENHEEFFYVIKNSERVEKDSEEELVNSRDVIEKTILFLCRTMPRI